MVDDALEGLYMLAAVIVRTPRPMKFTTIDVATIIIAIQSFELSCSLIHFCGHNTKLFGVLATFVEPPYAPKLDFGKGLAHIVVPRLLC